MIANYHTHTTRCGHARGSERDYAEAARRAGIQILGFSDHTPYRYPDGGTGSRRVRMSPDELPDYAAAVRALAEEYRGSLEILLGLEVEYYPFFFSQLLEQLRQNGVEYILLGQHFLGNEIGERYCGKAVGDETMLTRYVDQTVEALETGLFSCFAHPDLLGYEGDGKVYDEQMRRLCRAARETDTPLEINLLGIREGRQYPAERFWRLAAEEGNAVLLGADAHRPEDLLDAASEQAARDLARRCGIELIETLPIRRI
ncbi:MAG: histidinol-phosphatase [Oscillospiraceae bacterium]|nr:histidinol-phosphatase [Oscillospiraceae bacterium]